MSPASKSRRMPVALYRGRRFRLKSRTAAARARERTSPTDDARPRSRLEAPRLFSARCGAVSRSRRRISDIVRAVNTTLEPAKIARVSSLQRAETWLPAPSLGVVAGRSIRASSSVLAERGLVPDTGTGRHDDRALGDGPGQEFVSTRLCATHARLSHPSLGAVIAFPLSCRGHRVGRTDRVRRAGVRPRASTARRASGGRSAMLHRAGIAIALDNALLLKRAEALSVTDDLTQLYNSRYLNLGAAASKPSAPRATAVPLSLLFIDLRRIQGASTTRHGHSFGSRALVGSGRRHSQERAGNRRGRAASAATSSRSCCPTPAAKARSRSANASASGSPRTCFLVDDGLDIHLTGVGRGRHVARCRRFVRRAHRRPRTRR